MPIFEYICKQCKRPFEAIVMGSQKAVCPNCGSGSLDEKFSTYSVATGSGWRGAQSSGGNCGAAGAT
jgi:putative FmdB family regulatory protein